MVVAGDSFRPLFTRVPLEGPDETEPRRSERPAASIVGGENRCPRRGPCFRRNDRLEKQELGIHAMPSTQGRTSRSGHVVMIEDDDDATGSNEASDVASQQTPDQRRSKRMYWQTSLLPSAP